MGEADLGEKVRLLAYVSVLTALVVTPHHHHKSKPHAPAWFAREAWCIHNHEEHWSWRWTPSFHPHYSYWNQYYTGLQFAGSTWARANQLLHVHVSPYTDNPRIIILHAYVIVKSDGGSWREWSTAHYCGLS